MIRKLIMALLLCTPMLCIAADRVNINTANRETLISVNGIGPARADAIISYRDEHGPFEKVEDLTQIRGIGNSFINASKDLLTVE